MAISVAQTPAVSHGLRGGVRRAAAVDRTSRELYFAHFIQSKFLGTISATNSQVNNNFTTMSPTFKSTLNQQQAALFQDRFNGMRICHSVGVRG